MDLEFDGFRSNIKITNKLISIKKKKLTNYDEHTIPIDKITATKIQRPGLTSNGFIYIETIGSRSTSKIMSKMDYANDNNSIFFTKAMYEEAKKFKEALDKYISENI